MTSLLTFSLLFCIKQVDSIFAERLFSSKSQKTSKRGKNISDTCTRLATRVPLFCSHHILTSAVIYYWTDAWQYGIYLLSRWRFDDDDDDENNDHQFGDLGSVLQKPPETTFLKFTWLSRLYRNYWKQFFSLLHFKNLNYSNKSGIS